MRIGHPKNFWGGVLFALIGLGFALVARGIRIADIVLHGGYEMGVPARMGPGFFPFWLGIILMALGVAIALASLRADGGDDAAFPRFHWRPILWVLGAVVLFGVVLRPAGMLVAGFLLVFMASLGSRTFRARATAALGVGLVMFCALVFVAGLKLPIPLCPDVAALQRYPLCRA
jgi:hypothetical protein